MYKHEVKSGDKDASLVFSISLTSMMCLSVSSANTVCRWWTLQYTSVAISIHFSANSVISDEMYPVYQYNHKYIYQIGLPFFDTILLPPHINDNLIYNNTNVNTYQHSRLIPSISAQLTTHTNNDWQQYPVKIQCWAIKITNYHIIPCVHAKRDVG